MSLGMTEWEIHPFHSPRTNYLAGIAHDLASVLRTDIPVSIPTPSPRQGSFTGLFTTRLLSMLRQPRLAALQSQAGSDW